MNKWTNLALIFMILALMFCGSASAEEGVKISHAANEVKQQEPLNEIMEFLFPSEAFLSEPHPEVMPVGAKVRNATIRDNKLGDNFDKVAVAAFMVENMGSRNISITQIVVSKDSTPGMSLSAPYGLLSRKEAGMSTYWTENGGLPMISTISFNSRDVIRPGETAEIEILVGVSGAKSGNTLKITIDNVTWADASGSKLTPTRTESFYISGDIVFP